MNVIIFCNFSPFSKLRRENGDDDDDDVFLLFVY